MSVVIIAYPPSGGGNHLKNILMLDRSFENSHELNIDNYTNGKCEVHSTSGRNIQEYKLSLAESSTNDYILHGHFGELAPWRERINKIQDKKWILITIDTVRDRAMLRIRQHRLGQFSHPYYLDEEQFYLYQPEFYQTYFTGDLENIYTVPINDFWHPEGCYKIIGQLNNFLNKNVNADEAQVLHRHWQVNNNIDFY